MNGPKNIFLIIFVLIGFNLASQSFDEDFIASLPPSIRSQLLNEMNDEELISKSRNLMPPSTAIDLKDKDSEKFGVNYFNSMQTTFMPINEPSFDSEYVVGFGDELNIQLTGQKNAIINETIKRDGSITIPDIGKLTIAGLTLGKVEEYIQQVVSNKLIGVNTFLSLVRVRDIQILVAGQAAFPGVYTLPGNANLLNVLAASGGFKEDSSLRNIKIKRDGKTIRVIDLYQAFIFGDFSSASLALKGGDTIFISNSLFDVRIQGGVNRPGVYELLPNEDFNDLLTFANGFKRAANVNKIQLSRIINQEISNLVYSEQDLRNLNLIHEDVITIQNIETVQVTISGAVNLPGTYILPKGSTILDLVTSAGGYSANAYPFGGVFTTDAARSKEKESLARSRKELLEFFAANFANNPDSNSNPELFLNQFQTFEPLGRVSLNLSMNDLRNTSSNIILKSNDELVIPAFQNIIHIYGSIMNQGSFLYNPSSSLDDYIRLAGGLNQDASDVILVVHPNGESYVSSKNFGGLIRGSDDIIYPGSMIYVAKDYKLSTIQTTRLYLPIVSNLAITLASLASINKN